VCAGPLLLCGDVSVERSIPNRYGQGGVHSLKRSKRLGEVDCDHVLGVCVVGAVVVELENLVKGSDVDGACAVGVGSGSEGL
jgi:hypothetical protein